MRSKLFHLVFGFVLCTSITTAQKSSSKVTITGSVEDALGSPVTNAIILIDGETSTHVTDSNGKFKIKVKGSTQTIGIFTTENGFTEEVIDGRTEINFRLGNSASVNDTKEEIPPGEEGINTGYSYVKKKNLTTQIKKIDGTDKKYDSYSTIYDMIQREVSGVRVKGTSIIIQDSKNLWTAIPPLYVVDGAYVESIETISPRSVESIEVLKGTSAAMYGSRGYGGVIIIKTKLSD